jgi:hypothetical protein
MESSFYFRCLVEGVVVRVGVRGRVWWGDDNTSHLARRRHIVTVRRLTLGVWRIMRNEDEEVTQST